MTIAKIGAEIEGGFNRYKFITLKNLAEKGLIEISNDGSINLSTDAISREIITKPFDFKDINRFKEKITAISETISEINKSMGFHIHISFNDYGDYVKLFSYDFCKYFIKEYQKRFKTALELSRLSGDYSKNYKSETEFNQTTTIQTLSKYKNARYYAINYNAYNIHNTIEFRIFPMNTNDKLLSYIDFLIETINTWLKSNKQKTNNLKFMEKTNISVIENTALCLKKSISEDV